MTEASSGMGRLIARVFPKTPDFFALLQSQSQLAVTAMASLVDYMDDGAKHHGSLVKTYEDESDQLRDQSMAALNQAFSTPMDREDLYRAIATLDHITDYAKATVREMELLGVEPDHFTREMANELHAGAVALDGGYGLLATDPAAAEGSAQAARKSERSIEKVYRRALSELFDVEHELERMSQMDGPTGPAALAQVMSVFKRREVYRHLSNAGDRVARAGEALHDIVVKMV